MKYYSKANVYEEAKNRIKYLYENFDIVFVCSSGGKDSTVCFHLALEVAGSLNKLPVKVMQETPAQMGKDPSYWLFYQRYFGFPHNEIFFKYSYYCKQYTLLSKN